MASTSTAIDEELSEGVRVVVLELPEDEGEGLGFRLTRTLWDPYPWVREVSHNSRADAAGLKAGDCLLQADGKDLLGLPVGQVAGVIRGDGSGGSISLLVWNCGVDPKDDPDLLWSCGGGIRGEKSRRALSNVIRALACSVCASTATKPLSCARSHLYCEPCWIRLERCALCRESLPAKSSPYSRNLIAEQVFEAIATEYEIKNPKTKTQKLETETKSSKIKYEKHSMSAYTSPNPSPSRSPNLSLNRKGQYKHSMMKHRKVVHFPEKYNQTYASDPNIHRSVQDTDNQQTLNSTNIVENNHAGNSASGGNPNCQSDNGHTINNEQCLKCKQVEESQCRQSNSDYSSSCQNLKLPHKLVAKLRQACSLADLHNSGMQCPITRSLNSLGDHCKHEHHGSLDNMQKHCNNICDPQIFLLPVPPIYVVNCDHNKNE